MAGDLTVHHEAVEHARAAAKCGVLSWDHVEAEWTQDVPKILATLEPGGPYTWTLPNNMFFPGPDELHFYSATTLEEIEQQYIEMRNYVEVLGWEATTEIRSGWYSMTHGVSRLHDVAADEFLELESIVMFPVGEKGILGEVQIGDLGVTRENRWPEVPSQPGEIPLPAKRLHALRLHNDFVEALKAKDVAGVMATMRDDVATAIRSYLTDDYTVVSTTGGEELAAHYTELFDRFDVIDIDLVNRIAESWFVFAELYWTVEYRTGDRAGERVEFCTADIAPIDPDGKFWVRTGAGTDPIAV